jgi:hypothetical protein
MILARNLLSFLSVHYHVPADPDENQAREQLERESDYGYDGVSAAIVWIRWWVLLWSHGLRATDHSGVGYSRCRLRWFLDA